jgi:hypothetical protein
VAIKVTINKLIRSSTIPSSTIPSSTFPTKKGRFAPFLFR